jgi:prolyl-tRNA synthetase
MKGVPLRVEIGPKDIENSQCVAVRRDNREKVSIPLSNIEERIPALLEEIQTGLFNKAKMNLDTNIRPAATMDEVKSVLAEHGGFIKTMWCESQECEIKMKEDADVTSRCIPFDQERLGDNCPICGSPSDKMVVWGVAY